MFHSRRLEHRVNKNHERIPPSYLNFRFKINVKRIVSQNKTVSIDLKNLQVLNTEKFKAKLNISQEKF